MIGRPPRGITLLEMLIATAILTIILAAATGVVLSQNASYVRAAGLVNAREQGATAIEVMSSAIKLAGYGIDPQLAFDFDYYNCGVGPSGTGYSSAGTGGGACTSVYRDSINQADELVLHYRNPSYSVNGAGGCPDSPTYQGNVWRVVSATGGASPQVTLSTRGTPNEVFRLGRLLQIVCQDASTYVYATISANATLSAGCGQTTVSLYGSFNVVGPTGSATNPYSRGDLLTSACFSAGSARAFFVERQRYFVYQDSATGRPFLMLDQGYDVNNDGAISDLDLVPIASDVDDMQITYSLDQVGILAQPSNPLSPNTTSYVVDADHNGVWGDTSGTREQLSGNPNAPGSGSPMGTPGVSGAFSAANTRLGAPQPCSNVSLTAYNYPCLFDKPSLEVAGANVHPYRWTPWTGNIAEVRVALVSRGAQPTADSTGLSKTSPDILNLSPLGNRPVINLQSAPGWYGATNAIRYQHSYFSGSIRPINLASNGMVFF